MLLKYLRRTLSAAVLSVVVCGVAAAAAQAATLTRSGSTGGTLTYTGGATTSDVSFTETAPGEVTIDRNTPNDDDPIVSTPRTGCTVANDETFTCTGVTLFVATGGDGDDTLDASGLTAIPATLGGGAGLDALIGGDTGDTLTGDAGDDFLAGGAGDDTVDAGDGQDFYLDDAGNDRVAGGPGDDSLLGGPGNDDLSGGTGNDTAGRENSATPPQSVVVSLDDQANDRLSGARGEADNIRSDVETINVEAFAFPSGNDTLTGSAGANTLTAGEGNDTLDGAAGNDVLNGGNGDDTLRARDGFADFVNCGPGADTAEVDTLDRVEDCETINRADVGNANDVPEIPEDRPPTIAFAAPASGAQLRTNGPTTLTATASDDRGVASVLFVDDERIVCTDTTAPYTCDYSPRGEDVGRNTLVAIAIDTTQQTASVVRAVNVNRFAPAGITGRVTPARDRRAPFRFRSTGRLRLPAGVTPALGCRDGVVSIQVKAGRKTISTRRAALSRTCTFRSTVTFRDRRRFTRTGLLRFTLRFTGNEVLTRSVAIARNIRTR